MGTEFESGARRKPNLWRALVFVGVLIVAVLTGAAVTSFGNLIETNQSQAREIERRDIQAAEVREALREFDCLLANNNKFLSAALEYVVAGRAPTEEEEQRLRTEALAQMREAINSSCTATEVAGDPVRSLNSVLGCDAVELLRQDGIPCDHLLSAADDLSHLLRAP